MINIGIISGAGFLPLLIGKKLLKKKYKVTFFLLNNSENINIYSNYNFIKVNIISIKKIINILKENNINKIIMAGNIKRPSLNDLSFDFETIKLAKKLFLEKKGDNLLLNSIQKYFEEKGFQTFDWRKDCLDIFSNEDNLTKIQPSKNAKKNLAKALDVFKYYGRLDIGQSLIIQNQIILGLEAAEGTDKLIERCFHYKKKGDKAVLVKFTKYKQNSILDIPTIGIDTITLLKKYNYEGLFLEKNKCIILNKQEVKDFAEKNNIFISAINKIEK